MGPVKTGSASFAGHGNDIGALLHEFREWLGGALMARRPECVAFEKPVRPFANANLVTLRQIYSIAGMVELVCRDLDVPVFEVDNQQAKKTFYGSGGKKPKPTEAIAIAKTWGIVANNGDEADAGAIFVTTLKEKYRWAFETWEKRRAENLVEAGERLV